MNDVRDIQSTDVQDIDIPAPLVFTDNAAKKVKRSAFNQCSFA